MKPRYSLLVALAACSSDDGAGLDAALATASQGVIGVNDAPVLDASKSPVLGMVAEDAGGPFGNVGNFVSNVIDYASPAGQVDNVDDLDIGESEISLLGIAVTAADTSSGTWYFTTNSGTNWTLLGAVSDSSARVLSTATTNKLYFQPIANFSGTLTDAITFRAWDQVAAGPAGSLQDTTVNGGTSTFSTDTDTAALNVVGVNDAPILDTTKTPVLTSVNEDPGAPSGPVGTLVSTLVDLTTPAGGLDNVIDGDSGALLGIAVTFLSTTSGSWFYSLDDGSVWTPMGSVFTTSARLLAADARLFFLPTANFNGTIASAVQFRAWDRTTGTNGALASTSSNGGTTAFSTASDTASITVVAVNDAPVLDTSRSPIVTSIFQDSPAPVGAVGTLVSALIDPSTPAGGLDNVIDADSGAVYGIALTAADTINGSWHYTINSGANWLPLGAVSDSTSRLLAADSATRIYFEPNPGFNGTQPTALTFHAWDRTSGVNGDLASTTANGGATAFSAGADTASLTVMPPNTVPSATNMSAAEAFTEDTPLNLIDLVVTDPDGQTITARLTLSNTAAGSLSVASSGTTTSTYVAGTGVWTAAGPVAEVNVLLAGVTFNPALNFATSFTIATFVSDGFATPLTGSKVVTANAVNDAPTATNLSAAEAYTEDVIRNLFDIFVADSDNASVTVTLTLSDPAVGALTTATSGAVTSTYDSGSGVWTASGATANVNALLAGVSFVPALNSSASFTIATSVTDGIIATPLTGTKNVTGSPVNDAPTGTNLSAPEAYTEEVSLDLIDIVVGDVDTANVTVTLTLSTTTAGALSTATSGAVTSTYVAGTGVWTASGAIADVNALLAGVMFVPATNFASNFTIATRVTDGVTPVTGSKAMTGTNVPDPTAATNLSAAETYTEDTLLDLTNIVITDPDSSITITLTLSSTSVGTLTTGSAGGATSTYNPGTGVWTATGPVAGLNTLLDSVTFVPAINASTSFTIATSVGDGIAAPLTGTKVITGISVNDAPTGTNPSAPEAFTEEQTIDLTNIVVDDVDSANVTVTLTVSIPAAGTLSVSTAGSTTSTFASGVWTASGPPGEVTSLLAGVTYVPATDFATNFTIATSVSDGVAAALTGTKAITAGGVNDRPVAVNDTATVDQGGSVTIDVLANDTDPDGETPTIVLLTPPITGTVTVVDGKLVFTHNDSNVVTVDTVVYQVRDAAGLMSTQATVSITIVLRDVTEPGEDDGCGCQSSNPSSTLWLAALLGLVLRRRRRRPTPD